ncbi:MAG: methyltransferase family protein [Vulcanimicrobiaceae bacterium]
MAAVGTVILGLWITFFAFWLASGVGAKPTVGSAWWRGAIFRVILVAAIVLLVRESFRGPFLQHAWRPVSMNGVVVASVGVALCALGIGLAFWARVHLGRNWGVPMSLREGHELVTTGPYAVVRHPIYTGILFAVAGTALAVGFSWIVLFAIFLAYFVYAAKVEERTMLGQFPGEYAAYMDHTKMLIPFVF